MKVNLNNNFITDNSKECENGCYFLLDNYNKDYQLDAANKGAIIIYEKRARELLNINENIKIVAITGTNGKTTTAAAIYSMLLDLGKKSFLCGTRGAFCNDEQVGKKNLTTGFLLELLHYLAIASENDCEFFVMEVSSHAIAQRRYGDMKFAAKIYTNLTQDHLDYHKTFESYAATKASFFADEGLKFINNDAFAIPYNVKGAITYAIDSPALYSVKAYTTNGEINAIFAKKDEIFEINSPLVGLFNIYNLLAAFACVNELVKPNKEALQDAISNFGGVLGRMQKIMHDDANRGDIIIDFAHTPDGIKNVLEALQSKNLIVIVGAGGNRDASKRPIMAKIAAHFAKNLILTSDNPRDEEPIKILNDMLGGLNDEMLDKTKVIIDRKKAILHALKIQEKSDCIVILGKGDEDYQEIKGKKNPFSDQAVVQEFLNQLER